jgi:hypothetical protein
MKIHILNHNDILLKFQEYVIKMFYNGKNMYNIFLTLNLCHQMAKLCFFFSGFNSSSQPLYKLAILPTSLFH